MPKKVLFLIVNRFLVYRKQYISFLFLLVPVSVSFGHTYYASSVKNESYSMTQTRYPTKETTLQNLHHVPSTSSTSVCMTAVAIGSTIIASNGLSAFRPAVWSIKHCKMCRFIIVHRFWNHTLIMIFRPFMNFIL